MSTLHVGVQLKLCPVPVGFFFFFQSIAYLDKHGSGKEIIVLEKVWKRS